MGPHKEREQLPIAQLSHFLAQLLAKPLPIALIRPHRPPGEELESVALAASPGVEFAPSATPAAPPAAGNGRE